MAPKLHSHGAEVYPMRYSLPVVAAAALFMLANVPSTSGQDQGHEVSQLNSCIREFYDPEMYKLLTFKNTCSQSLTVMFFAKDESGIAGKMELRPGAKDSVGRSQGKKIPKIGSLALYVCPVGYVPVDTNNQVVSRPVSNFRCQSKPQ